MKNIFRVSPSPLRCSLSPASAPPTRAFISASASASRCIARNAPFVPYYAPPVCGWVMVPARDVYGNVQRDIYGRVVMVRRPAC